MSKKNTYTPDPWESKYEKGKNWTRFAPMHETLLLSAAYIDLSPTAKVLLQYCKLQKAIEKQVFPKDYSLPANTSKREQRRYFVMNRHKWKEEYKITSSASTFNKCMEELIMHGFVDCVFQGKIAKVKNVYRLSDRWQQYENEDYAVDPKYMTAQMLRSRTS